MTFPAVLLLDTVERLIDTAPHTTTVAHVLCDVTEEPRADSGGTDLPRAPVYRVHGLVADVGHRTVSVLGRPVELTCMELELLAHFLAHPRRAFTPDRLMELVWQQSATGVQHTVDVHIARLRNKLGPRHGAVITSAGQAGYLLDPTKAARWTRCSAPVPDSPESD
ncbi:winged helix-turn-helix domain-containing protein [Streptomyces luteireticuli]|uniref:winged helix-turn-helix domain-containing protein n=1 Tax=Streptomyces luteireticuli TaxID=173858 RepID=UPI003556339C